VTSQQPDSGIGQSLAEIAYQTIKRKIIRCELEPGSQVTEAQLTERYGLGRAAVRTALSRLPQERLVHVLPRQGYTVAPLTLKSVRDLFTVRLLLEPAAAAMAARHVDTRQLRRLDELCRASYQLGDRESAEAFLQANTEFHLTVARASGNERLVEILSSLLEEMERFFHLGLMLRDRNDEMFHEHHDLVDALEAGNGERAEQVTAEQIRTAQKMVIEALRSSPSLESVNLTVL
jgi:DNA-binding GntR family transcriptional regulator